MRTSKAKFEFRKIAHLIEQSEMMVLPKYFLVKTSEAKSEVRKQAHLAKQWCYLNKFLMRTSETKFEFRKIAHIDYIIFLWRG